MIDKIKYAKNKGYCYDNRHLFSELRKILLKQEKPLISKEMTTIKLHKLIEEMNKVMANKFIETQSLKIPYLGNLMALERTRYYCLDTKKTNIPVFWGKTRQMKRNGELSEKQYYYNADALKLVKILFSPNKSKGNTLFRFRVCQDVATKLIHYITDNDIPLLKYKTEND